MDEDSHMLHKNVASSVCRAQWRSVWTLAQQAHVLPIHRLEPRSSPSEYNLRRGEVVPELQGFVWQKICMDLSLEDDNSRDAEEALVEIMRLGC